MSDFEKRVEALILYVTTPHPMLHPWDWLRFFKKWVKKLIRKRDSIEEQFVKLEVDIDALSGQGILDVINKHASDTAQITADLTASYNNVERQITNNLSYWAQWQIDNL